MLAIALAGLSTLLSAACSTGQGTYVNERQMAKIREGLTTQREVIALLGTPEAQFTEPGGGSLYQYTWTKTSHEKSDHFETTTTQKLDTQVRFTSDQRVETVSQSWGTHDHTIMHGILHHHGSTPDRPVD